MRLLVQQIRRLCFKYFIYFSKCHLHEFAFVNLSYDLEVRPHFMKHTYNIDIFKPFEWRYQSLFAAARTYSTCTNRK